MPRSVHAKRYKHFRTLLIEARKSIGLTQAEVARRLGRPQSYVSKYEGGERRLDVVEFLELARALKINPATFVKRLQRQISRMRDGD